VPRISPEARAAALWRAGAVPPQPPRHLSRDAKAIWREVVGCRPADFFQPGALHLLEQFCAVVVVQRVILDELTKDPTNGELVKRAKELGTLSATLAQKLRLSIQSALRGDAGRNAERQPPVNPLLGGSAVWERTGPRPRRRD
jgi:phage terminase small subunit